MKVVRNSFKTHYDARVGLLAEIQKFYDRHDVKSDVQPRDIMSLVASCGMFSENRKNPVLEEVMPRDVIIKMDFSGSGHTIGEINISYQRHAPDPEKVVHMVDPFHPVVIVTHRDGNFDCSYYYMGLPEVKTDDDGN